MFGKKKEKTSKKIDKLVTGVIIGSAIASIFGLSRTKKGKKITHDATQKSKGIFRKAYGVFGKCMSKAVGCCTKNKVKDKEGTK